MGAQWFSCDHDHDIIPRGNKQASLNMMMLPGPHMINPVNSYLNDLAAYFLISLCSGDQRREK